MKMVKLYEFDDLDEIIQNRIVTPKVIEYNNRIQRMGFRPTDDGNNYTYSKIKEELSASNRLFNKFGDEIYGVEIIEDNNAKD